MGLSTVMIGLLPTYASIGVLAPALLALCRFGQGIGLGGEWGGAVLLAFGRRATARWLNLTAMHETESAAVLFFLLVGIAGIVAGAGFLGNLLGRGQLFDLYSAGVIPLRSLFIGVKVAISLFVVLWMLAHVDLEKGDEP